MEIEDVGTEEPLEHAFIFVFLEEFDFDLLCSLFSGTAAERRWNRIIYEKKWRKDGYFLWQLWMLEPRNRWNKALFLFEQEFDFEVISFSSFLQQRWIQERRRNRILLSFSFLRLGFFSLDDVLLNNCVFPLCFPLLFFDSPSIMSVPPVLGSKVELIFGVLHIFFE